MKKNVNLSWKKALLMAGLITVLGLTGCSKQEETQVVLTTGFSENEVFRIETQSCSLPEMKIYLANMQNQYEDIFGDGIWNTELAGKKLEGNIKDTVLAKIAQIKVMNLLSEQYGVALDQQEEREAKDAAIEYFGSLNDAEKTATGVTTETIETIYREYALADKVYHYMIRDIKPEISDDEARTITVEHILLKTYYLDDEGNKITYSENEKNAVRRKAESILEKIRAGEDFEAMVSAYNEDRKSIYSFGLGEMEESYEKAAFDLGTDEVSDVVETQYGYHIIKCINTFNREETDANKIKIVEQRRREVFNQEYDVFAEGLIKKLNEDIVNSVTIFNDPNITTHTMFDVYDTHFAGAFDN